MLESGGPIPREAVRKYETFVEEVLLRDLRASCRAAEDLGAKLADLRRLRVNLEALAPVLAEGDEPLRTRVELGSGVFVAAEVEEKQKLFVELGFGFFLEMSVPEALAVIAQREPLLEKKLALRNRRTAEIDARVAVMAEAMNALVGVE